MTWNHRQVTTPALREAARAIVLDPGDRVRLLRYDENGGFWANPGGSLEPGETYRQAVIRELREELGVQHVTLGPHLATRAKDHPVVGRDVRQVERYYLARVLPPLFTTATAAFPGRGVSGAEHQRRDVTPASAASREGCGTVSAYRTKARLVLQARAARDKRRLVITAMRAKGPAERRPQVYRRCTRGP
jgi:ADP-ribose pyrophosphatase YjhB (NUDIX family)